MADLKCDIFGNLSLVYPHSDHYTRQELINLLGGPVIFVHLEKSGECMVVREDIRNSVGPLRGAQYNAVATKWVYDGVDYPIDSPDYIAGPVLLIDEKHLKFPIY